MKLSIVIPIYNEEKTLTTIINAVESADLLGWDREIILVDDASVDNTPLILKEYESKHIVLRHEENLGKGSAVKTGLDKVTGDFVLIQDADLEYDPNEIKHFIRAIKDKGVKVVYGSRNIHHIKREGFVFQRLGVWLITYIINILYKQKLTDVWTCYKLFPAETKKHFVTGKFESELLFTTAIIREGYSITEVPISHRPRPSQEGKKIRYRDGFYSIFLLITEKMLFLRKPYTRKAIDSKKILVCPHCKSDLLHKANSLFCNEHGGFKIDENGRPFMASKNIIDRDDKEHRKGINWLKSFLKQFPKLYYSVWHIFCPALMITNGPRKIFKFVSKNSILLDIGSGPERLSNEFINIDIFPFPEVDIIADAESLPIKDETVDAVVNESVLEHVREPLKMVKEMVRVLKKGGYLYASAPFIHPFHASPDDFNRWTINGLKNIFSDLDIVESGVRSGPWSAFLLFSAYWLGNIFSLGNEKIAPFLAHIFMLVLGPLKYLDLIFMYIPGAHVVSTHVYIVGKKK